MTAPTTHDDILDLNALTQTRPKARILTDDDPDGIIYELAIPEDFGAASLSRLGRVYHEHDELWEKAKRTRAEDKRLEQLLDELGRLLIPDAPAAAVAALPALTKRMVAVRFFMALGEASTALIPEPKLPEPAPSDLASI